MRSVFLFLVILSFCAASDNCAWFIGKVRCTHSGRVPHTIVEIWDEDFELGYNEDDLAGYTVIDKEDEGVFKVEGCASDVDFLFFENNPEFYLRVTHSCKGKLETLEVHPPHRQLFAPFVNDHFMHHPIYLG